MRNVRHKITNVNPDDRTAICSNCGPVRVKPKKRSGVIASWGCRKAHNKQNRKYKNPYKQYKEDTCTRCGFEAEDRAQLDVHHIDGNHFNNDPTNLTTLCANCHRLVHALERKGA